MLKSKSLPSSKRGGQLAWFKRRAALAAYVLGVLTTLLAVDIKQFSNTVLYPQFSEFKEGEHVDLIAVLTGGKGRIKEAVELLSQRRGDFLFISGVEKGVTLDSILAANQLTALAEPFRSQILIDNVSETTAQNAVEIRRIVKETNAGSILLVTSRYHMDRALKLIKSQLSDGGLTEVELKGQVVESPNFDDPSWWNSLVGWRIVLQEYAKRRLAGL